MHKLLEKLSDQLGDELAENISDSVIKTVETMFGQKMFEIEEKSWQSTLTPIAVNVVLTQNTAQARLRLVFDRSLLSLLIAGLYPRELLGDETCLKDAAAEIANIVCNKIKLFLSKHGYQVTMGFPEAVDPNNAGDEDDDTLDLKFSLFNKAVLSDNRILHVNFV